MEEKRKLGRKTRISSFFQVPASEGTAGRTARGTSPLEATEGGIRVMHRESPSWKGRLEIVQFTRGKFILTLKAFESSRRADFLLLRQKEQAVAFKRSSHIPKHRYSLNGSCARVCARAQGEANIEHLP